MPPRGLAEALRAVRVVLDPMQTGPGDPHLQHHAGRAPARRGGADRGAMSGAAVEGSRCVLRRSGAHARLRPLRLDAVPAAGPAPRAAGGLRLQCRDIAGARPGQPAVAGEIRLQWWTDMLGRPAMATSRAIRSPPNCCRRSAIRAAGRAAVAADRGAPVRPLQRSDAVDGGAGGLSHRHFLGAVLARRGIVADNPRRSSTSRAMPASRRAWRR